MRREKCIEYVKRAHFEKKLQKRIVRRLLHNDQNNTNEIGTRRTLRTVRETGTSNEGKRGLSATRKVSYRNTIETVKQVFTFPE